jgi:hypothetical protein
MGRIDGIALPIEEEMPMGIRSIEIKYRKKETHRGILHILG